MKLYVGCGKKKLPGYKHQDIVEYPHVDYICACWSTPLADSSCDEVYSRHLFEHLLPKDATLTLKEWHRILKPDGKLIIIVPDLEYHAKQLLTPGKSPLPGRNISNFDHAMYSIYGWITEHPNAPGMEHKWGYTRQSLSLLVKKHFGDVVFTNGRPWEIYLTAQGALK